MGGITPAGAGKTDIYFLMHSLRQDHPRRCGENIHAEHVACNVGGSPPQVRGKRGRSSGIPHVNRITPAGAGKTAICLSARIRPRDHPRRCGENAARENVAKRTAGSPPQVRGKHATTVPAVRQYRITPAGAGKTKWFTSCPKSTQDHPRRCGENIRCSHTNMHCLGSPPQVRGKLNYCKIEEQRTGITPAGAGKTHCQKR